MSDITDEMVEACARRIAARDTGDRAMDAYDTECVRDEQQHYREMARVGLEAALAGRTVVELPEPDGADDTGTWWRHDHGEVIADSLSGAESARFMRRRAAALLAAAEHIERRRVSGSVGSETRAPTDDYWTPEPVKNAAVAEWASQQPELRKRGGSETPAGAGDAKLSPAMRRNLVALLDAPYWHPSSPGEWRCAEALSRRGLLDHIPSSGFPPYELNAKGRAVAEQLRVGSLTKNGDSR